MGRPAPGTGLARRATAVRRLGSALLVAAVFASRGPVGAQEAPTGPSVEAEIARLLSEVASDEFAAREAARAALRRWAREGRRFLEARREDPDPEVRRTVEALLADLGDAASAEAPVGGLGGLGRVSLRAKGPLRDVLEVWERGPGGRLRIVGDAPDAVLSVDLVDRPYFEALAEVLGPLARDVADGFDEAGQATVVPRDGATRVPTSHAGPFRLEVDTITTTRSLRAGVRPRFALMLRLLWAPDVQVTSFASPEVLRAVDEEGHALRGADGRGVTYGLGGGRHVAYLQTTLDAEESHLGARIAALELRLRVRVRHGRQEALFEDLAGPEAWPRSRTVPRPGGGGTQVTLVSFGLDPEREGWAVGVATAHLARGIAPEGVGAALETMDGLRRPMVEFSSRVAGSDGTLRMTLRAGGVGAGSEPKAVRVAWFAREEEVSVPFLLEGVPLR